MSLRDYEQVMAAFVTVNAAIFLAWRIPALQRFMARHFLHHTHNGWGLHGNLGNLIVIFGGGGCLILAL